MVTDSDIAAAVEACLAPAGGSDEPGAAVLVTRGGEILHRRGHGLASLEFGVPIGPDTAFRIASITKQFTCAVAIMLAREGKLDLDAEVQALIPEMTRYDLPVTLRMLMRNVSGVRDSLECLRLAGGGIEIPHSHEETVGLICRQLAPNFPPGSSYLYSNANFLLLTEAIQRVTGRWLGDDIRERLLDPLGMTATRLGRAYAEVIPNLATGYVGLPADDGTTRFERGVVAKALSGEGGMVSTLDDLGLWLANYRHDRFGLVEELATPAVFTNGVTSRYGHGLVVDYHRGTRVIGHGGLWPGYRSEIVYAPDLDIGVIVLANTSVIDPHVVAGHILDAVAGGALEQSIPDWAEQTLARRMSAAGPFVDPETGDRIGFVEIGGRIMPTDYGAPGFAEPVDGETLRLRRASGDLRTLRFVDGAPAAVEATYMNGETVRFVATSALPQPSVQPADIAGRYEAGDLAAIVIEARDGGLTARIDGRYVPKPAAPLEVVSDRALAMAAAVGPWTFTNTLTLERDGEGRVTGLKLRSGRLKDIPYRRVA